MTSTDYLAQILAAEVHGHLCACTNRSCGTLASLTRTIRRAAAHERDRCIEFAEREWRRCNERRDGAGRAVAARILNAIGDRDEGRVAAPAPAPAYRLF